MEVLLETPAAGAAQLRVVAAQRVRLALRRFSWLVPRARVRLTDINGPRGGVDKRCRVEIRAVDATRVVITALARDWQTALDLSLARAMQALVRACQRRRALRRSLPRRPGHRH